MSATIPSHCYIVSAEAPNNPIGPDSDLPPGERLVVSQVEAERSEWAVDEAETPGKYWLTVAFAQFTYESGDHNVVVRDEDRGQVWRVRHYGNEEYTIERDSDIRPNAGWTMTGRDPKSPVNLQLIGDFPLRNQLWKFVAS